MLDGRVARMTGTTSAFGVEFDSLADVISFGMAPAILAFAWGLQPFGRLGWAAGFIFVSAAAIRLARFNIQSAQNPDKRYFVGMPSPAAAGVPAATVFAYPYGLQDWFALLALPMVLVPAFLMVSTIRYRSFKTLDLGTRRSYRNLLLMALVIAAIATHPADHAGDDGLHLPASRLHRPRGEPRPPPHHRHHARGTSSRARRDGPGLHLPRPPHRLRRRRPDHPHLGTSRKKPRSAVHTGGDRPHVSRLITRSAGRAARSPS